MRRILLVMVLATLLPTTVPSAACSIVKGEVVCPKPSPRPGGGNLHENDQVMDARKATELLESYEQRIQELEQKVQ